MTKMTPAQLCDEMTDETIIGLAQTCRVSMNKNGKLLQAFERLQADARITGANPFLEPYNAACECYNSVKSLMAERGINPANPQPRQ